MKRSSILIVLLALVIVGAFFRQQLAVVVSPLTSRIKSKKTVADRVHEHGASARARLAPHFEKARVSYPPTQVMFVGLKNENRLELYAAAGGNGFRFIRSWPILAASGGLGPKLREGDQQVPEGIYPIDLLNPNSRFHLSLRVGYPNQFDREQAQREGRSNLGGDIMIHGNAVSVGCLAMGDEAAEDLFVLAADAGLTNITVVLTPVDFRKGQIVPSSSALPAWTAELYPKIKAQLAQLPAP